jgi:DNA-binding NtrC family response regulator
MSSVPIYSAPLVLVVDDDPQLRTAVGRILRSAGYAVSEVRNAADALAIARRGTHIDLLLTDIILPRTSGIELARMIRALDAGTRVLYMTGHAEDPHVIALTTEGEILRKPFGADRLLQTVSSTLADGSGRAPATLAS